MTCIHMVNQHLITHSKTINQTQTENDCISIMPELLFTKQWLFCKLVVTSWSILFCCVNFIVNGHIYVLIV